MDRPCEVKQRKEVYPRLAGTSRGEEYCARVIPNESDNPRVHESFANNRGWVGYGLTPEAAVRDALAFYHAIQPGKDLTKVICGF